MLMWLSRKALLRDFIFLSIPVVDISLEAPSLCLDTVPLISYT